ncbi:MAG: hypothetical protein HDQ92_00520 [Desulfovibrio sp.]|nr:hypothetical protein [Desulfovibrio sp.]
MKAPLSARGNIPPAALRSPRLPGRLLACAVLLLLLCACAESPDGTLVLNEETVENFFEGGALKSWNPPSSLNLLMDQPVTSADIPPVPPGQVRLFGTLDSVGPYTTTAAPQATFPGASKRGSTFRNSVFGMLGPAGTGGNAWFYADVDLVSRQIITARAYLYGFNGGVCDMRESVGGSRGEIGADSFTLSIGGYCAFPSESGTTAAYALLIRGQGTPLAAPAPENMPVAYIVDNNGKFTVIPKNPRNYWEIYDYGTGMAHVGNTASAPR